MPIILKDPQWHETETRITVQIPLKGIHSSKVDIFYSDSYLKASFCQFFCEIFLLHPINRAESSCTFTSDHIIFELIKRGPQIWSKLEAELSKAEKQELKKVYIEEEHRRIQEECEERKKIKSELKRIAIQEQMSLDAAQRATIENIRNEEKTKALQEMCLWKDKPKNRSVPETVKKKVVELPPPRRGQTVKVEFTPRDFPTPCRESRLEEETEWLRSQAEARRATGFVSEDIRPEERNPQYLKAKGDEFLRTGNYLGALSAYSFGIKLNEKFVDLYIARSEAHLHLGNFGKVAQDCSAALELMKPEVASNLKERALCIGRRGQALIKLGMVQHGIDELKASLRLVANEDLSATLKLGEEALNEAE